MTRRVRARCVLAAVLRRLLTFLRQPYPVLEARPAQWRRAGLIGLFVGGFLLVFEPFGLSEWQTPLKSLKIAGFGLVSTLITFGWYVGIPALVPGFFRENRWTVGRAALFLNGNIVLIAAGNLLYLSLITGVPLRALSPGWMLASTFLIGAFPAVGATVATYIRQLRRIETNLRTMPEYVSGGDTHFQNLPNGVSTLRPSPGPLPPPARTGAAELLFTPENGKDTLSVAAAEVLYLEAADNYCTVVYGRPGAAPTRALLRASLSRLAGQATEQGATRLVRVHRSYLVSLDRVARVSGNAQGYRLHLAAAEVDAVPVGRTYAEAVLGALRSGAVRP